MTRDGEKSLWGFNVNPKLSKGEVLVISLILRIDHDQAVRGWTEQWYLPASLQQTMNVQPAEATGSSPVWGC